MSLNQAAFDLVRPWLARADGIGAASNRHGAAWVLDCGVEAPGGSEAGLLMARAALGMESMTFGLAMPDEDVHAPNEFFRLSSFDAGLKTWPMLLTELGKLTPEDFK